MKTCVKSIILVTCAMSFAGGIRAGESIDGTWKTQFDSQIGVQKYTYVFHADGTNVTGTATGERDTGTNTVAITEGKISKDEISFVEPLKFGDNELRIEYTGKIAGDEIKFHRKVGDVAEEDFVARRMKHATMKSGMHHQPPAPATNAPAAKP